LSRCRSSSQTRASCRTTPRRPLGDRRPALLTCAEVVSRGRLVTIDGNGRLHPAQGEPLDVITDQIDTVAVQWGRDDSSWVGWLTTTARRTVRFAVADLEDPVFQRWLRSLPGWDYARLWRATTRPGVHLVWPRRVMTAA
jgi:hypothetical protein